MQVAASGELKASRTAQPGYPAGGLRFDWMFVGLSVVFIAGLWIDGWAHFHGKVDSSFFTPWHFLFYSAFGINALFLGVQQWRNQNRGYRFQQALPQGYWLALVGAMLFALGGVGDMIWHTLFGIEGGSEALTSPSHLLLGVGMILIFTGPLRAAWGRGASRGWRELGPAVISGGLLLTMIAFFTSYAHPIVEPAVASRGGQDAGVASILLQMGLMSGVALLMVWRWRLPFGALTLILTGSTFLLTLLNDFYVLAAGALVAGLLADVLLLLLKPSPRNENGFHWFAFLLPVIFTAAYFGTIELAAAVRWSIHVWSGAIFLAGVLGALLSYLMTGARAAAVIDAEN